MSSFKVVMEITSMLWIMVSLIVLSSIKERTNPLILRPTNQERVSENLLFCTMLQELLLSKPRPSAPVLHWIVLVSTISSRKLPVRKDKDTRLS